MYAGIYSIDTANRYGRRAGFLRQRNKFIEEHILDSELPDALKVNNTCSVMSIVGTRRSDSLTL